MNPGRGQRRPQQGTHQMKIHGILKPGLTFALTFLLVTFLASGCRSPTTPGSGPLPSESLLTVPTEVILSLGDEIILRGTDIRVGFSQVPEDSRCPVEAICIWQGNGVAEITMAAGAGAMDILRLNTTLDPRSLTWKGILVTLEEMLPLPSAWMPIPEGAYSIKLQLRPSI
ncbi:MAG: hypothetical protein PVJ76_17475 [Gemmatimonadota bacterium]